MSSASASMAVAGVVVTLKAQGMDPLYQEMEKIAVEMGSTLAELKSTTVGYG